MTTLPQTISARPRPAQSVSGVPAVASPALTPAPYTPPAQAGLTGADVWRVIRQNLWVFLLAGLVGIGVGYGLNQYLKRNYQQFTAEGAVKVRSPRSMTPVGETRPEVGELDLKTMLKDQSQRLRSEELLTSLLINQQSVTRNSEWLKNRATVDGSFNLGRALTALKGNFSVAPGQDSSFIVVSMTAGQPDQARDILLEIVNTHISNLNAYNSQDQGREVRMLEQFAEQRRGDVATLENEMVRLGTSVRGDDNQSSALLNQNLAMLATEMSKANSDLTETSQALQSAKDAIARGTDPAQVTAMVNADPLVRQYRQRVTELQTSIDVLSGTVGTNSRTIKDLQRQLDEWRDNVREEENTIRAQSQSQLVSSLESAVASSQERVNGLEAREEKLNEQLLNIARADNDYKMKVEQYRNINEDYNALMRELKTKKFEAVNRQQEEVTWASLPITPQKPSFPDLKLTVGLCTMLFLGLAVGLAFLREVMDTSVRSPRDIGRVGQMNVLGMIPDEASDPEAGDPLELTIANAPHSMSAEQYRTVRSRLGHVTPLETTRTILVTSPQPGDGKTTVACNLAAGMALNGRKILLVDANFRRPGVHAVFDLPCDEGLADVLADVHRFDDLVRETSVPNLFVLPAGNKPTNPTELIEGAPFTEFVDAALDEYDHVIFDSGPILFVSETGALAPQCDGVVSVVRARKSSRGLLGRMRDSLRSLNVEHLGVVLNAVRGQAGGYYSRNIKTFYAYQRDGK